MKKVISIDGGGIKGIVASTILQTLENKVRKPLHECTDIITGTSTGGLIACGLTIPNKSGNPQWNSSDVVAVYESFGPHVFSRTFWHKLKTLWGLIGPMYPIDGLEEVLQEKFGDIKLRQALTEVLICTYDLHQRRPVLFSSRNPLLSDITMKQACMGTSSIPALFPTVEAQSLNRTFNLIDGGIFAVNPALCALAVLKHRDPNDIVNIISIGNGNYEKPLPYKETKDWGLTQWAGSAVSVILDGINDAIGFQTKALCESNGGEYLRLQFDIPKKLNATDNTNPKNIAALRKATLDYIARNPEQIERAVKILKN